MDVQIVWSREGKRWAEELERVQNQASTIKIEREEVKLDVDKLMSKLKKRTGQFSAARKASSKANK